MDSNKDHVIFFVVVNFGMGSKILKEAKALGVKGGTIFLGKGTAKSHFLELLGLDEIKKEIVMMISESSLEEKIHKGLTDKFHMNKPNHGIIFSSSLNKLLGTRNCVSCEEEIKGGSSMAYEAIFTIVNRGHSEEVVDAAKSAGAEGATIINGRGSGVHENSVLFSMPIEPEKEIVMILIDKNKSDDVIKSIREAIHIDEPGKGIMFTIDVNNTSGLANSK